MCDCINDTNERTLTHFRQSMEGKAEVTSGELQQVGFVFSATRSQCTYTEFEYKFRPVKANGELGAEKKKTVNMIHSFCPFCGEKQPNA